MKRGPVLVRWTPVMIGLFIAAAAFGWPFSAEVASSSATMRHAGAGLGVVTAPHVPTDSEQQVELVDNGGDRERRDGARAGAPVGPVVVLPEGYRKPGELSWGWPPGVDGILPSWFNGNATYGSPDLLEWLPDGEVVQTFDYVDEAYRSGKLQLIRPTRPISERWGAVVSVPEPNAVASIFAFSNETRLEVDFEWRGDEVWALNVHIVVDGKRCNPRTIPTVPMSAEEIQIPHRYEFELDETSARFFIDGEMVEEITPADMPEGCPWDLSGIDRIGLFTTLEKHGPWARHDYDPLPARMIVHGILI